MSWLSFWIFRKENTFYDKVKQGIVFYNKPGKNKHIFDYNKPLFDRRIVSKRVFTHTRK